MELSQDVGPRPIGIMVIKPSKIGEWKERINAFHEKIQYWIDNVPDKTITIQLFY